MVDFLYVTPKTCQFFKVMVVLPPLEKFLWAPMCVGLSSLADKKPRLFSTHEGTWPGAYPWSKRCGGRKFFGLLQRTACLVIKKGVSATQTWRGWKDTSAPTFKSGRGTIAPTWPLPASYAHGGDQQWHVRFIFMTYWWHVNAPDNAKPGSLLRVKITTVFISCIFLHHHHKSASQSEVNWRNRKKLFETYARFRHKQITVDKASLSVFQEQKSKVISNVYILRA